MAASHGHRGWPETDTLTSTRMSMVGQRDTAPELAVRRVLRDLGLRYRIANPRLPGKPDASNTTGGWALFVHGCFWHRHAGCPRSTTPRRNRAAWLAKFQRNVERDQRVRDEVEALGLRYVQVWECQTKDADGLREILMDGIRA